jgi:hypothetical protein
MCYILFGAYQNHKHTQIIVKKKQLVGKKERGKTEKKSTTAQIRD